MRYTIIVLSIVVLLPTAAAEAAERYWIFFADKGEEEIDSARMEEALEGLSDEAIERRLRNGYAVPFDPWDLSPLPEYVSEVEASAGIEVRSVSPWLNAVSIECDSTETNDNR